MKKFIKENSFYLKTIILIFVSNAIIYFGIKLFINNYNLVNIPLDDKIPFIKEFIYIYMIWYPFLIFNYYIIYKSNKEKYINSYERVLEMENTAELANKVFSDKKMLRTFPNLKLKAQDGELIYMSSIYTYIQPYYYKFNF